MSELVGYQRATLGERMQYAQTLAHAGDLIPRGLRDGNTPSAGKILLVMETGAMLGLNPMAALQGIDVIEGKATISPQLMSGLIRAAGHKLEIIKTGSVPTGDIAVTARLTRSDGGEPFESTWDMDRAVRAGLVAYTQTGGKWAARARSSNGKVLPWEAYTESMLQWRAVGDVGRAGADDVLKGVAYTSEEIQPVDVGEMGEVAPKEPTQDWALLAQHASTAEEMRELWARAVKADEVRTTFLARVGAIEREAQASPADEAEVIDGEVVEDTPLDMEVGDEPVDATQTE